ncbi:uncharacterized protein LDX57_002127 [Aspergillus melleus]|uniref:uncharacterized protein n=1 Tax=Aspergillus melleus TaxID=138277 RepID=UPI001E8EB987|nr:uncharacterized protein LDX57_002127 [Aspergillus melleus]KAH8424376.1 hypothetical protein LDX57_002127 [Aspergillus melleus]
MPGPAADTALSIPELLEAISLHLDMSTVLLSAQRVNKHWLATINDSIRLQQLLYFKPIPSPRLPAWAYSTPDNPWYPSTTKSRDVMAFLNPLLFKHFGTVFFDLSRWDSFHRAYAFTTHMPWWADDHSIADWSEMPEDVELSLSVEPLPRQKAFTRAGASWRRMPVSQPAPLALGHTWQEYPDRDITVSKGIITETPTPSMLLPISRTGLYMGLLYDLIQYHAGHHEQSSLYFRILWGHQWRDYNVIKAHARTSNELLKEVGVVVQFVHKCDSRSRQPADVRAWDSAFKSEDFQLPEHETVEVWRGSWDDPDN